MTNQAFDQLKLGDRVVLASQQKVYGTFFGHHLFVQAGTEGVVGAVKCTPVTGRRKHFACVDFPAETQLVSHRGNLAKQPENKHRNNYRVGVFPEELI